MLTLSGGGANLSAVVVARNRVSAQEVRRTWVDPEQQASWFFKTERKSSINNSPLTSI